MVRAVKPAPEAPEAAEPEPAPEAAEAAAEEAEGDDEGGDDDDSKKPLPPTMKVRTYEAEVPASSNGHHGIGALK
eukprot:5924607-Pyramimonas_sp.AAC.1